MGYFKTSLDSDISYLLNEIGHTIKINNVDAKAIINNTDMERNFDDKRIITETKISRGDYVSYNDLYFIVINEINMKRYNLYYKGIIRRCNYDFKIVLDNKLYLFYAVISSDKFGIDEGKYISTMANTITITLPLMDTSKKIKENDRIIKFNKAWKVEGIDYTENGLIKLHCKTCLKDGNIDNMEEEIADFDKLDEDYSIIYPFDKVEDDNGNGNGEEPPEPPDPPDPPEEPEEPEEPEINYYIIIEGANKVVMGDNEFYTAKVYDLDDERVSKLVTFSVDDKTLANIKTQGNNQCELVANMNFNMGNVTLRATLVENDAIYGEKIISVNEL